MSNLEYIRPWLPEYQTAIIDSPERYSVTEATTKAGKTVVCIVWLTEEAMRGKSGQNCWWIAPVYSQAEIAFNRLKRFFTDKSIFKANESKLTITLINGVTIWFKTAEKPDNLFGEDVIAAVLDEFTRMKEKAWFAVRSTLTATKGKCKFIGNVNGIANWGYQLARKAEAGKDNWKYFKITADDAVKAGILDQEEINDAEGTLPRDVFLELYYGIPNESASNKFCYSFSEKKHIGHCKVNPNYPVILSFDFNYNPICCGVYQSYDNTIFCCELVKLPNSNIYDLCNLLVTKFKSCVLIVTGDASGKANTAITKDAANYYTIIKQIINPAKFLVPASNPKLEQNQVLVNAILENMKVIIDLENADELIFDCKFVTVDNEGKIVKTDRNDPAQQADALDTFRYYLNAFHRNFIKIPEYA